MKLINVHREVGWGGGEVKGFVVTYLGRGENNRILGSNKGGIFFLKSQIII